MCGAFFVLSIDLIKGSDLPHRKGMNPAVNVSRKYEYVLSPKVWNFIAIELGEPRTERPANATTKTTNPLEERTRSTNASTPTSDWRTAPSHVEVELMVDVAGVEEAQEERAERRESKNVADDRCQRAL